MGLFVKRIIAIAICALVTIGCQINEPGKKQPTAIGGVLQLAGWDFNKDGIIFTDGEWLFFWEQLFKPDEITGKSTDALLFNIPNKWNSYQVGSRELDGHGFGTFKLTLEGVPKDRIMSLKILDMGTSYRLWVNGELLMSNGYVGKNSDTAKPQYLPQTASFISETGRAAIVLQVSNFSHRKGGVWKPLELGLASQINEKRENNLAFELFLFGSLLIMGLYHFGIYLVRNKDKSSLYFGGACLLTALRVVLTGERFLIQLIPSLNWEFTQKLEYMTFYLGVPLFPLFLNTLFPEFKKRVVNSGFIVGIVFSIFTIVTPVRIFSYGMPLYQALAGVYCVYAAYALIRAVLNKRESAALVSIGVVVLIVTVLHDILLVNEIIHTISFVPAGLFFFIFFQSFLLSLRFSTAFTDLEVMSGELSKYANEMEVLVDQRTSELKHSNEELRLTNKKISDSIECASIIQTSLLPDIATIKNNLPESFFIWKPRDVVGGDYFMLETVEDGYILAVVDCTGHGIPGALMTMLASSALRRIVVGEECNDPSRVLKRLNHIVKVNLKQDKAETKSDNGLDGSVCFINNTDKTLVFAGARQPLVHIVNSEVRTIKGDRHSIGYKKSDPDFEFTNHTIKITEDSIFYLYTDGVTDQSIDGKPFSIGHKRFKEILNKVYWEDFESQRELIVEKFNQLKGKNEIRDDITIVGFRPYNSVLG